MAKYITLNKLSRFLTDCKNIFTRKPIKRSDSNWYKFQGILEHSYIVFFGYDRTYGVRIFVNDGDIKCINLGNKQLPSYMNIYGEDNTTYWVISICGHEDEYKYRVTVIDETSGDKVNLITANTYYGDKLTINTFPTSFYESITWSALKDKRDGSILEPSKWYRITDYNTTTVQSNTQAAGHQFDVIVLATDVNKLSEEARAIRHSRDMYFSGSTLEAWKIWYCLDNDTTKYAWADSGATGRGVIYRMIDEWNNECPYDFKNIQFARWELTNPVGYVYNESQRNYVEDSDQSWVSDYNLKEGFYSTGGSSNDIMLFYDDKLGAYKKKISYTVSSVPTYCYTFGRGLDASLGKDVYGNIIKEFYELNYLKLNNLVFLQTTLTQSCQFNTFGSGCRLNTFGSGCIDNAFGSDCQRNIFRSACWFNTFGDNCRLNTFGDYCDYNTFGSRCADNIFAGGYESNTFGDDCIDNTFGDACKFNTFGNNCESITLGNECASNTFENNCESNIFGSGCTYNTFGNGCGSNIFGSGCTYNTFGNGCGSNTFGDDCGSNTFGNNCESNIFGSGCGSNTFGDNSTSNTFGDNCSSNTFENDCRRNTFGNMCRYNTFGSSCARNTFVNRCFNNTFGGSCESNIFGDMCRYNTFGSICTRNTFGNSCNYNTFGNGCQSNTFGNYCQSNTFGESVQYFITGNATGATTSAQTNDYIQYLIVENGVRSVNAYCTGTTSDESYCQNIKIGLGVKGTSSSNRMQIDITPQIGATASVTYQPTNSQVISV